MDCEDIPPFETEVREMNALLAPYFRQMDLEIEKQDFTPEPLPELFGGELGMMGLNHHEAPPILPKAESEFVSGSIEEALCAVYEKLTGGQPEDVNVVCQNKQTEVAVISLLNLAQMMLKEIAVLKGEKYVKELIENKPEKVRPPWIGENQKRSHSDYVNSVIYSWITKNLSFYPTAFQKEELEKATNLSTRKLDQLFSNKRRRDRKGGGLVHQLTKSGYIITEVQANGRPRLSIAPGAGPLSSSLKIIK